jgi:hypothetical protein
MSEKTYTTPGKKEPELVITPMGSTNELGVKLKRKAIKFLNNGRNVGQFTTGDKDVQAFIEAHPWYISKQIVCVGESNKEPEGEIEQSQATGAGTSEIPVKKGRWPKK